MALRYTYGPSVKPFSRAQRAIPCRHRVRFDRIIEEFSVERLCSIESLSLYGRGQPTVCLDTPQPDHSAAATVIVTVASSRRPA